MGRPGMLLTGNLPTMNPGQQTLHLQVDLAGRRALLATGQRIVIVRVLYGAAGFVVASAVADPFGNETDIGFHPAWKAFVQQGSIRPLDRVRLQLTQAMAPGGQTRFDGTGFGPVQPAYAPTVFGLKNGHRGPLLSAGLAQQLTIASETVWQPVSIAPFPYNEIGYFEPTDEVLVFPARGIIAGQMLPTGLLHTSGDPAGSGVRSRQRLDDRPPVSAEGYPSLVGGYLRVSLTADTTIHFDNAGNCFRPGPLAG